MGERSSTPTEPIIKQQTSASKVTLNVGGGLTLGMFCFCLLCFVCFVCFCLFFYLFIFMYHLFLSFVLFLGAKTLSEEKVVEREKRDSMKDSGGSRMGSMVNK
jgi:hypothetical protein